MDMSDRADLDLAETAEGEATSTPLPLDSDSEASTPFPVDALGNVLKPAALAIHDLTQAPLAMCCQSVLAAASLAVQAHVDVVLPFGQKCPSSCFYVTVAASGERKTSCDKLALQPIRRWLKAQRKSIAATARKNRQKKVLWDTQHQAVIEKAKTGGANQAAIEAELQNLGAEPGVPQAQHVISSEPTIEGLFKALKGDLGFAGIYSSEAGAFLGGHGMNRDNRLKTAAYLSLLWDGEPISRTRGTDELTTLHDRRLSAHLMMQLGVSSNLLGDPMLKDQGLLSRVLVSAPATTAGTRFWKQPKPTSKADLEEYCVRIMTILDRPRKYADGDPGELQPRDVPLSVGAQDVWIAYHDAVEEQLSPKGEFAVISGFANKLPQHAARLAVTLAVLENFDTPEVSGEHMVQAIKLAEYYCAETLRLFGANQVNEELERAQKLLRFMKQRGGTVDFREIRQLAPYAVRDKDSALRTIRFLEESGWIKRVAGPASPAGKKMSQAWAITQDGANEV